MFSSRFLSQNYDLDSIRTHDLIEYKKIYSKVNHLRNPLIFKKDEIFFTKISNNNLKQENKKNILIQGDSWIENLIIFESTRNKLIEFSRSENLDIIIAGVSSYSPSVYHAQFNVLKNYYGIVPDQVIVMFDQTDFGDEICRYKNMRRYEKDELVVKNYDFDDARILYNLKNIFLRISILNDDSFAAEKLIKILWIKVKEQYLSKFINKKKGVECTFDKIIDPLLTNAKKKDYKYFNKVVDEYFNELSKFVNRINVLTHPHYNHVNGKYKYKITDILNIKLLEDKYSVDFFEFVVKNDDINNVYIKNDIASHPNEKWSNDIILTKILGLINLN